MLNSLPEDILIYIMIKVYNLQHSNLVYLMKLMRCNKDLYFSNYDISKKMMITLFSPKIIIKYEQHFTKKSDWWLKLLYFYALDVCHCKNIYNNISSSCDKCNGIIPR
tara:strand:+ start:186 stop:509 length:324 start_codon:yes stop_codon:yes gene_type:complete